MVAIAMLLGTRSIFTPKRCGPSLPWDSRDSYVMGAGRVCSYVRMFVCSYVRMFESLSRCLLFLAPFRHHVCLPGDKFYGNDIYEEVFENVVA